MTEKPRDGARSHAVGGGGELPPTKRIDGLPMVRLTSGKRANRRKRITCLLDDDARGRIM